MKIPLAPGPRLDLPGAFLFSRATLFQATPAFATQAATVPHSRPASAGRDSLEYTGFGRVPLGTPREYMGSFQHLDLVIAFSGKVAG